MSELADKLRSHVADIEADAASGSKKAQAIINLYQLHVACPSDPGAPALCSAAFDEWRKSKP